MRDAKFALKNMPAVQSSSPISRYNVETGADWDAIVRLTVEACLHRSEGRERVAAKILQESLPAAIRAWSKACGSSAAACRDALKGMFFRVREQVTVASVQRRMILAEIAHRAPVLTVSSAAGRPASEKVILRERIRFDDVTGMLDALADAEADCASFRPAETVTSSRLALSV
jgi:hypothetical protein